MLLIGIDGNEANVEKRVGIGEYAFELLSQLVKIKDKKTKFVVYLKDAPLSHLPPENEFFTYRILRPGKLWTQWRLPFDLYLQRLRPDVFFTPSHYAPRFAPCPTVIAIMDVSYFYFPELFTPKDLWQLKNWTAYSIKHAAKIITISNSAKRDIIEKYQVAEKTIEVIYPGLKKPVFTPHVFAMKELQHKYGISDNYLLYVGTLQPRKNIKRLIEAFAVICQKNISENLQLVIVGKKGWLYDEILSAPQKMEIEDKVKFLNFVPDHDLVLFYKNALAFVWPSLYEGFGLPILEAMQQGCPVITSNVSSMPEAGGDAAIYVNPLDVDDIAKNLESIIYNSELRNKLINKGYEQVKKFSWEKTAQKTLKVLEEVNELKRHKYNER